MKKHLYVVARTPQIKGDFSMEITVEKLDINLIKQAMSANFQGISVPPQKIFITFFAEID